MTDLSPYNPAGLPLANCLVVAPMTGPQAHDDVLAQSTALDYDQHATAAVIVGKGAPISRGGQGDLSSLGVFTPEQIAGWRLTTKAAHTVADDTIDLEAFGLPFISKPDLAARLRNDWPLTPPDRTIYYSGNVCGFADYAPHAVAWK